jgi:hypothetical protein
MTPEEEFSHLRVWTDTDVCSYLASKVRNIRRQSRDSQEAFALKAGIPLRTYKRFEAHGKANLETFVQVLRALGRTGYLFMLFPTTPIANPKPSLEERLRKLTPTKFGSTPTPEPQNLQG